MISSMVLAIITFFYLLATRRMAKTMYKEYELRIKPFINIYFEVNVLKMDAIWIFSYKIENKGIYPINFVQYQITLFLQKDKDRSPIFDAAYGAKVFIDQRESYSSSNEVFLKNHPLLVQGGEKEHEVIIEAKFGFLDCIGKTFEEIRRCRKSLGQE